MESLKKFDKLRLSAALIAFIISSFFTAYLAWSEKQSTHALLDLFIWLFKNTSFGWVQPTVQLGVGLFLLYLSVELPTPSKPLILVKFIRKFRISIFFRFLPFAIFFSLFGGFLLGPGLVYLMRENTQQSYAYIAMGLYSLLIAILFAWLPSVSVFLLNRFRKRQLLEAICRAAFILFGFLLIIGAIIS